MSIHYHYTLHDGKWWAYPSKVSYATYNEAYAAAIEALRELLLDYDMHWVEGLDDEALHEADDKAYITISAGPKR